MDSNNSMDQFFTKDAGNKGIEFPLLHPDTGKKSGHFLVLRSVDSDAYKRANIDIKRRFAEYTAEAREIENRTERENYLAEKQLESETFVLASLVKSWSFDKPCTQENIIAFLDQAPQIAYSISLISARRELFLAKGQDDSKNLPDANLT